MGGPALTRPAPILYHGLQPRVKPRGVGAPQLIGLGRQGRPRLRAKAILLDRDRGNDAGMSRSVPRADRSGVANCQEDAPRTALKPQLYERGGTVYLVTAQRGKGKLEVKTMWEAQRSGASC